MIGWLPLALAGHLANGLAFIIDKALLSSSFKRSATYAASVGTLSLVVLAAAPWVKNWPGMDILPAVIGFGVLFVFALWLFFEALRRAEASRIVPIIGSLIPLFSLVGTYVLLTERLTPSQLGGFGLLLIATILLTRGRSAQKITLTTIGIAISSALLFAAASLCGKYAFDRAEFLSVFVVSRAFAGVTGLAILLLATGVRQELFGGQRSSKAAPTKRRALGWMILGQLSGALGFVMVNAALAQGSVAIVNALQAVQYVVIVLVAWFGGRRLAKLLKEDRSLSTLIIKGTAIVCVGIGLSLIA